MSTPQQWLQEILTATEALLNDEALNHQHKTFVEAISNCAEMIQNNIPEFSYDIPIKYIISEICYESRSLFASIRGYSDLLLISPEQFGAKEFEGVQKQHLTLIYNNGNMLWDWKLSLINSVQTERQKMHNAPSQETNLDQFLENYLPQYQYLIKARLKYLNKNPVEFIAEIPENLPLVMANYYHLSHLIQHLILTIATELIEKGTIYFSATTKADFVVLSISSPSLQLTAESLETLFQKQGRDTYRKRLEEQGGQIRFPSQSKIDISLTKS